MSQYEFYNPESVIRLGRDPKPPERIGIGCDIGFRADYSTMAVIRHTGTCVEDWLLECLGLQRWPLNTPHRQIEEAILAAYLDAPDNSILLIDRIGGGQQVSENVKRMALEAGRFGSVFGICWHGGQSTTEPRPGDINTPKAETIHTLTRLVDDGKLLLPEDSTLAQTLKAELFGYQQETDTLGREKFGSEGKGKHDDLLCAVALATIGLTHPYFVLPNIRTFLYNGGRYFTSTG